MWWLEIDDNVLACKCESRRLEWQKFIKRFYSLDRFWGYERGWNGFILSLILAPHSSYNVRLLSLRYVWIWIWNDLYYIFRLLLCSTKSQKFQFEISQLRESLTFLCVLVSTVKLFNFASMNNFCPIFFPFHFKYVVCPSNSNSLAQNEWHVKEALLKWD